MKKLLMAMLVLAVMAGCSSEPSKPAQTGKPQAKAPELVTGRAAFQKAYIAARGGASRLPESLYRGARLGPGCAALPPGVTPDRRLQGQGRQVSPLARFLRLRHPARCEALRMVG